ncbi:MAG: hypothetical protein V2J11_12045 [Desulfofustis sp.]|nr:hypothetical protein [Desulfofustis sp.]
MLIKGRAMNTWNRCVFCGVVLLSLIITERGMAATAEKPAPVIEIDAVWTEFDGIRHEIFHASRQADQWSDPEMITDDYFDNQLPVIDRDSRGRAWLAWTAYDRQQTELRATSGWSGDWQETVSVAGAMTTNTSPSLVVDGNDVVWLVWSANSGGLDDIYYTAYRDGAWTEPVMVHGENDWADVLPTISLSDGGSPIVQWQALTADGPVYLVSEYNEDGWADEQIVDETGGVATEAVDEDVILPEFIENIDTLFLRIYR